MGAWIETLVDSVLLDGNLVAPLVGAWIETADFDALGMEVTSHPSWVRGLKQYEGV